MSLPRSRSTRIAALLLALGVLSVVGCCGLRCCPRIDPTGERCLIWPKHQPERVPPPASNPQAPPVLTDPFFPAQPVARTAAAPVIPPETVKMTPERVLAPIGSEVVLKAGVCESSGYLLSDQKLEWQLARNGVGQFVQVGGKGLMQPALLPWNQPDKVDNYFAKGYTAASPLCITRGTSDPSDDINIRRGDGWVSVTSPVEGTSYVTALAPSVTSWRDRQATAQIHWVDVQWSFPPADVNSNGKPQTLTTTVTRQSDGTPLQGYLVRYEVADGGALRGETTGQDVEVRTDLRGQAAVEVSPTDSGANKSRIDVQLIRPADFGSGASPRLVIANSATIVHWTGDEPYITPGTDFGAPSTPLPGASGPPVTTPAQPIPAQPVGRPQLEVEIFVVSEGQVEVGGQVRFEVAIKNVGDAPATGLEINDRYEAGFQHIRDPNRFLEIKRPIQGFLAPGQSTSEFLTFDVLKPGRTCHDVTITCAEGATQSKRACADAVQPPPELQPAVEISKVGPLQAVVNETAVFSISVKNTGEVSLTNLEITDEYPAAFLTPQPQDRNYEKIGERIVWRIPRLEVGKSIRFDVDVRCLQDYHRVVTLAEVTAQSDSAVGAVRNASEHIIDILPARGGAAQPGAANASNLQIKLTDFQNSLRAGTRAHYRVTILNAAQSVDEQVEMRVSFPAGMTPDVNTAQGPPGTQTDVVDNRLLFTPVAAIRPDEEFQYEFDANVNQPGSGKIVAEVRSRNTPNGVQDSVNVEIIRQ